MTTITALRAALAQEQATLDAAYQQWLQESHAPALRSTDSQGAFAAGWRAALAQEQAEPVHKRDEVVLSGVVNIGTTTFSAGGGGNKGQPLAQEQAEQTWVCPDSAEHRYPKPGHCENCGKPLVLAQAEPPGCDHCNHPLYAATRCRVCGRVTA